MKNKYLFCSIRNHVPGKILVHLSFILFFILIVSTSTSQVVFYGMTSMGGTSDSGNIFSYNVTTGAFSDLVDFTGMSGSFAGKAPNGSLIQASDGNLYGMTVSGGINGLGNIFKYNPITSTYTDLVDFTGTSGFFIGETPYGDLVQAYDGNLYGMTELGGVNGYGNIFRFNPITLVYTDVIDFTGITGAYLGWAPNGSLMLARDSNLYGMTLQGGPPSLHFGNIFKYNLRTGAFADLVDFTGTYGGSYNGLTPYGGLIGAKDSNFYGMTEGGGIGIGNIFSYNPRTHAYRMLLEFSGTTGPSPGEMPYGNLVQATDSNLYGITTIGGAGGYGNLFKFNPYTLVYSDLIEFTGGSGPYPGWSGYGSLIQASDSNLYGMTHSGGATNKGNIFNYNIYTGTYTDVMDFSGNSGLYNGKLPRGSLLEYRNTITGNKAVSETPCEVVLYPNPASDKVNIKINGFTGKITLILYDISGRELLVQTGENKTSYSLHVSTFVSGIYLLKIQEGNEAALMREIIVGPHF